MGDQLLQLMVAQKESWQNGYCTGLENRRPQGLAGSNPALSASSFCISRHF
jgi:hypothetical protein